LTITDILVLTTNDVLPHWGPCHGDHILGYILGDSARAVIKQTLTNPELSCSCWC